MCEPRIRRYSGSPPVWHLWILLLLCSWLTLAVAQTTTCPDFTDCVCYEYDGGLDVDCSSRGLTEIPDFSNLSNTTSIFILDLSNNSIQVIGSTISALVDLTRLVISTNNLSVIGANNLSGFQNLETLELENNSISELEDGCFTNLSSLVYIDLSFNHIEELRRAHFENLTSLTRLDLRHNRIHTIEDGTFADDRTWALLSLSENQLTQASLPSNVFVDGQFTLLDLSNNMLSAPPLEALASASQIGTLKLNNNSFSGLEANAFRGISAVSSLDLSYCSLTTESMSPLALDRRDLPGLRELQLDGNYFSTLNGTFFAEVTRSLALLAMRNCDITAIAPRSFRRLPSLATLLLSGNNFGELGRNSFHLLLLDVLDLSNSNITNIARGALRTTIQDTLYLDNNNITVIHSEDFKDLHRVKTIVLSHSNIHEIRGMPFAELDDLQELFLEYNHIRDEDLVAGALHGPSNLYLLDLTGNNLTQFPNFSGMGLPLLLEIHLAQNQITRLERERLRNLYTLQVLVLKDNPLTEIEVDAFASCGNLTDLNLDYTKLTRLPNMANIALLEDLHISFSNLESLPLNLCVTNPKLLILRASGNKIGGAPQFTGCRNLISLALDHNRIGAVTNETFAGMRRLNDIKLSYNDLEELPEGVFRGVRNLHYLRLQHNKIRSLPDNVFADLRYLRELDLSFNNIGELRKDVFRSNTDLDELLLNNNDIDFIDSDAFPRGMNRLVHLNLSSNDFPFWRLPIDGFPVLQVLALENVFSLHQVPNPHEIPQIQRLYFTYSYHCCIWRDHVREVPRPADSNGTDSEPTRVVPTGSTITLPPNIPTLPSEDPFANPCPNEDLSEEELDLIEELERLFNLTVTVQENCRYSVTGGEDIVGTSDDEAFQHIGGLNHRSAVTTPPWMPIECSPEPNPLTPCENLMDPWVLRVAIWAVWVIAVLGNGTVLFVMIVSREKFKVPQFLICNLAFADFCLGLYLAFLAVVDVRTYGNVSFYQSALDWQLGHGCKAAGFIAVFSSELSVFILVMLTLERVHTIVYAFYTKHQPKMWVAFVAVVVAWVVAAVLAYLPLVGINSYDKVAVCLPYVTEEVKDKAYIGFILSLNLAGLAVIVASYIYIFYRICKSPSSDQLQLCKSALKIAVLIVVTFLCWTPLAILGYSAIAGNPFINVTVAKFFIVFVYPLNACLNPVLYALVTRQFRERIVIICKKAMGKVQAVPPTPHLRLQRAPSTHSSDFGSRVQSPRGLPPEDLLRLRQSRRSNSFTVQLVNMNSLKSPTPPVVGARTGRRASLPAILGPSAHLMQQNGNGNGNYPRGGDSTTYPPLPFRLGPLYYQEENDTNEVGGMPRESAETAFSESQISSDSGVRRLSVVIEGSESEEEEEQPMEMARHQDNASISSSDSEDYSDAHHSLEDIAEVSRSEAPERSFSGGRFVVPAEVHEAVLENGSDTSFLQCETEPASLASPPLLCNNFLSDSDPLHIDPSCLSDSNTSHLDPSCFSPPHTEQTPFVSLKRLFSTESSEASVHVDNSNHSCACGPHASGVQDSKYHASNVVLPSANDNRPIQNGLSQTDGNRYQRSSSRNPVIRIENPNFNSLNIGSETDV